MSDLNNEFLDDESNKDNDELSDIEENDDLEKEIDILVQDEVKEQDLDDSGEINRITDINGEEKISNVDLNVIENNETEIELDSLIQEEEKEDLNNFDEIERTTEENGNDEFSEADLDLNENNSEQGLAIVSGEVDKGVLARELKELRRNLIEGALYAAGRPLDIEEISTKLEIPKKETELLTNELAFNYLERSSALIIALVGERYQMQLRPEYTERVAKFAKGGAIAERYLRTLTVIALKQPILKSTVVKLRGSGAYEHVKYLLDNELISAVKKGRTHELSTTDKYAEMFGLPKDKQELKRVMVSQLGIADKDEEIPNTD